MKLSVPFNLCAAAIALTLSVGASANAAEVEEPSQITPLFPYELRSLTTDNGEALFVRVEKTSAGYGMTEVFFMPTDEYVELTGKIISPEALEAGRYEAAVLNELMAAQNIGYDPDTSIFSYTTPDGDEKVIGASFLAEIANENVPKDKIGQFAPKFDEVCSRAVRDAFQRDGGGDPGGIGCPSIYAGLINIKPQF